MKSTKLRDSEKPDLQFALRYPSETDKLRLGSGTVLQREITDRERRKLDRERRKEKEIAHKAKRVTSSSEAMDTDEANRHTQNILSRVSQQQEPDKLTSRTVEITSNKTPENSDEETLGESDMDTTILGINRPSGSPINISGLDQDLGKPSDGADENLQRSLAWTLRFGTPPPILGISPTTTKLTLGLSRSLENMSLDPLSSRLETRSDLGVGYANNEFYLPIAGCPSVSELEPQLTDKLTLKGNRAKLLHVPLWNHTYYTSRYLIGDVAGEIYACHQDEIIAIKEQGYLQKEMAEEIYLEGQIRKGRAESKKTGNSAKASLNCREDTKNTTGCRPR